MLVMLAKKCRETGGNKNEWDRHLDVVVFTYNTTPQALFKPI